MIVGVIVETEPTETKQVWREMDDAFKKRQLDAIKFMLNGHTGPYVEPSESLENEQTTLSPVENNLEIVANVVTTFGTSEVSENSTMFLKDRSAVAPNNYIEKAVFDWINNQEWMSKIPGIIRDQPNIGFMKNLQEISFTDVFFPGVVSDEQKPLSLEAKEVFANWVNISNKIFTDFTEKIMQDIEIYNTNAKYMRLNKRRRKKMLSKLKKTLIKDAYPVSVNEISKDDQMTTIDVTFNYKQEEASK